MGLKLMSRVLPWALFTPVNGITLEYTVLGLKIPTFWGKAPHITKEFYVWIYSIWLTNITVRLPKGKLDLNWKKIFQQILTLHLREHILYCIVYNMSAFGDFLVNKIYTNEHHMRSESQGEIKNVFVRDKSGIVSPFLQPQSRDRCVSRSNKLGCRHNLYPKRSSLFTNDLSWSR